MVKERINIDHELKSNSATIIWNLISTDAGLSRWLADEVKQEGDVITFLWGETWRHHEIRKARVMEKITNQYIRMVWEDEEDENAYMELKMEKSVITNDYILTITDYASPEDVESIKAIWSDNLTRLRQSSGL